METFEIPPHFQNESALEFNKNQKYSKYEVLYIIIRHLYKELSLTKNNQIPKSYIEKV